jgi:hypothetical protein
VALARDRLKCLIPPDQWDLDTWDVSTSFVRKGKHRIASRLPFLRHGSLKGRGQDVSGEPFPADFGQFARAFIRYQHSAAPMVYERLASRLLALRYIDAAFRSLERPSDIPSISSDVMFEAVRIAGEGVTAMPRYQRATILLQMFEFFGERRFLASPFAWKHGIRKPKDATERVGEAFDRRRSKKIPSRSALHGLALAFRDPQNARDDLLSAVTAICLCVPIRIHEALQLRSDCVVSEERRDGQGGTVAAFGIRVWPGKGNAPQVKWVPDMMVDLAREAVDRLRGRGDEARAIADWYIEHPDCIYLPPGSEHLRDEPYIDRDVMADLVGYSGGVQWARMFGLEGVKRGATKRLSYPFADFERAVLSQLPNDFPNHNGHRNQPYSESLVVVRKGSLRADTVGRGSRIMFEAVSIDMMKQWLGGNPPIGSVFERYGATNEDGSPIRLTSHGFRHWLNDVAHRQGLGAMDIAHWSGRDVSQNRYYDHQTPQEFQEQFLKLSRQAGGIGPVFEAADALPDSTPISRAEFLAAQIGSAHQTDLGACIHDYSLLPCQKSGNCLECEENVFVKGDRKHAAAIGERRALTAAQLEAARSALADGEFGADLWVQDHEAKLVRLDVMLSVHRDGSVPDMTLVSLPANGSDTEVSLALRQRDTRARAS